MCLGRMSCSRSLILSMSRESVAPCAVGACGGQSRALNDDRVGEGRSVATVVHAEVAPTMRLRRSFAEALHIRARSRLKRFSR
jgi:hypothetical protein